VLGLGDDLRLPHLAGVVPFGSVTAPDLFQPVFRAQPHSPHGDRSPKLEPSAPGTRLFVTGLRIVETGAREIKGNLACRGRSPAGRVPSAAVVPEAQFEQMVADALDEIPPELGREMENVAVVVEDWPTARQLASVAAGGMLLGLYEGIPITRRGPLSYAGVAPDRITIFRGPLSRLASDDADLARRVRVTVLHEVGHYFGMSDDRLRDLGWA
jgi:predicted Zn-dependent protease with MMP-like domain